MLEALEMTHVETQIALATPEQALEGFKNWLISHTNSLMIGARWLSRLDELNIEVDGIRDDVANVLRRIARGEVYAGVVSLCGSNTSAIEAISTLPLDEQRRIAENPMVDVAVIQNGEKTNGKFNISLARPQQLKRLIRDGVLLSPEQQLQATDTASVPKRLTTVRVNKADDQLVVNGKPIDAVQVRLSLEGLSRRPLTISDPKETATITLPREVVTALKSLAIERDCSTGELIWKLLRVAGY